MLEIYILVMYDWTDGTDIGTTPGGDISVYQHMILDRPKDEFLSKEIIEKLGLFTEYLETLAVLSYDVDYVQEGRGVDYIWRA